MVPTINSSNYLGDKVRSFRLRAGGLALAVAILSACTQTPRDEGSTQPSFAELRSALDGHLAECTDAYGLNPREQSGIGENELAVGEQEWLECAYQGIEAIMVPNTKFPDMYHQLISDSRSMTALVEQGEMTRTQRRNVLQAAIVEIENAEIVSLIRGSVVTSAELDRARTAELRSAFVGMHSMTFPQGALAAMPRSAPVRR
jgi:hypothetical protein